MIPILEQTMRFNTRWPEYVPVAERRARAQAKLKKMRKKGETLQPVQATARGIATTFWGRAWCRNLEAYSDYENRLPRGRSYLRNGSVLDLQIARGEVRAQVAGSELYRLHIRIAPLPDEDWHRIRQACAGGIASAIELLQGRLSDHVMGIITAPGAGLFPSPQEIKLDCSCPDWADMCKHVAAVLYGVAVRLDERPDLLFLLRGVDHLDLIAGAGAAVAQQAQAAAADGGLAEAQLAEVFGIDIAPEESPTVPPAPATPAPPARETSAKRKAKPTVKKRPARKPSRQTARKRTRK